MADLAEIAEALAVYEVHAGFPEKRMGLAGHLLAEGVAVADIELVGDHCRSTVEGVAAAARVLASLLLEPRKLEARLADLRVVRDAQAKRAFRDDPKFGDRAYVAAPIGDEPREVWEHDRQCEIAVCRVDSDRRSVAEVAREMGVSETTLGVMLARGRFLRAPRIPSPKSKMGLVTAGDEAKAASEQRQSIANFRQRMRDDGLKAATNHKKLAVDGKRLRKCMDEILETARQHQVVDIGACLLDRVRMGALVELENAGAILRDGPPDHRHVQPYRVARNDQERAQFRDLFRGWNQRGQLKPMEVGGV